MSKEFTYWTSVLKRIGLLVLAIILTFISFKIAIFYMPFLIAFAISLLMEPLIKFFMNKCKFSRRASAIIVFIITFGIIIGLLSWGIVTLISESNNLLINLNDYYDKIHTGLQYILNNYDFNKIKISDEILEIIKNSSFMMLEKISNYVQNFLTNILTGITSIPKMAICFAVTILALYFICTDKIYMLDELEYHLPEKWMKELTMHLRELIKVLGGYLKAQLTLIFISFVICLIRIIYIIFCWTKCRISFDNSIRNSFC
jgi:predicted PurR-regulated permease PerM